LRHDRARDPRRLPHERPRSRVADLPARRLPPSPEKIAPETDKAIRKAREEGYEHIFIGYADCGTGGMLDKVCAEHGVERIAGPHCFSFYIGNDAFDAAGDDWMTTFFVTDFLARHFETFLVRPLGLDRHPELRDMYFGAYDRLLYLAQTDDAELTEKARGRRRFLGLAFERQFTAYGDLTPLCSRPTGW
jgi:hypothetical protein